MKQTITKLVFVCACLMLITAGVEAQSAVEDRSQTPSASSSSSAGTVAKVPVVIVGSAAKATWVTTKFAAKHLAKPVAKAVIVKATPAMTKFALKNSVKYLLPFAVKLSVL